jgi:hypothetical protein
MQLQLQPRQANKAQRDMYHSTHFGVEWTYITLALHLLQFSLLLSLGFEALPLASSVCLLLLVVAVPALLLLARHATTKHPKSVDWSYLSIKSPQLETDGVPDRVILLLSLAALLEGAAYALFSISTTGQGSSSSSSREIGETGFRSYGTITQVRFALLCCDVICCGV